MVVRERSYKAEISNNYRDNDIKDDEPLPIDVAQ